VVALQAAWLHQQPAASPEGGEVGVGDALQKLVDVVALVKLHAYRDELGRHTEWRIFGRGLATGWVLNSSVAITAEERMLPRLAANSATTVNERAADWTVLQATALV
jgi:hypothetical protein